MKITCPEFKPKGSIPPKFTEDGEDVSPTLNIEDIPPKTKTLALIVDDPDAPMGTFVHWVVFNIKPTNTIPEDSIPGVQGISDYGKTNFGGPAPPPNTGTHRYFFKLYALDIELDLPEGCTKKELESAMKSHILAQAEYIGTYTRDK